MLIYDKNKRELSVEFENEYIIEKSDKSNVFKGCLLSTNDNANNYECIIIDDLDEYMTQFIDNEE